MNDHSASPTPRRPVAIGGVGGSGTRVIAAMLEAVGYFIGSDLNEARDNLWFTLLFKYREVLALSDEEFAALFRTFKSAMIGGQDPVCLKLDRLLDVDRAGQHDRRWLEQRVYSLQAQLKSTQPSRAALPWGWKEPNTHLVLDRIIRAEPSLTYIHVARNGLDMAFSSNQNQLHLWGPRVLSSVEFSPRGSLSYWRWAHERILALGQNMQGRFYLLNFDLLCDNPRAELERLFKFLRVQVEANLFEKLVQKVIVPKSSGRHRARPIGNMDSSDLEFLTSLGFSVQD